MKGPGCRTCRISARRATFVQGEQTTWGAGAWALRDVEQRLQRRIFTRIADLAVDPRPAGAERLQGSDFLRIRVGEHRIIYTIEDERLLVLVLRIAHRREAYRDFVRLRASRS